MRGERKCAKHISFTEVGEDLLGASFVDLALLEVGRISLCEGQEEELRAAWSRASSTPGLADDLEADKELRLGGGDDGGGDFDEVVRRDGIDGDGGGGGRVPGGEIVGPFVAGS